jgi:hypothetical protein
VSAAKPEGVYGLARHAAADAIDRESRKPRLPLLTRCDLELETAARACRALAHQESERAKAMENSDMKRPIEHAAARRLRRIDRFEALGRAALGPCEG